MIEALGSGQTCGISHSKADTKLLNLVLKLKSRSERFLNKCIFTKIDVCTGKVSK